ncbi:MAG: HDOD domain-containing protein [Fimbriimonadaceae bacterium]
MSKPNSITLEDIVSRTSDLPTFSAAALEVMRMADSSTSRAQDIARIVSQDQAMSVRVLRLANSAFYGMSRKVSSLPEAVVVLGMRTVKNLAMVAATYPWMSKPLKGYDLAPMQMWHHSFGTALAAQTLAARTRKCDDQLAFTSGLLHDVGKVALSLWIGEKLKAIVYYAEREGMPFDEAERRILGYDHTEVGEHLGKNWNLPEEVLLGIRWHHEPESCEPYHPVADCVHLGSTISMAMGIGLGGDGLHYTFSEGCYSRLGLRPDDTDSISADYVDAFKKYETMFAAMAAA